MNKLSPYYKAAAGFVAAAVVAYLGATDGGVTQQEWLTILLAGLGGSGLVFVAPKNAAKTGKHADQSGNVDVALLFIVLTFIGVVLLLLGAHSHALSGGPVPSLRDTNWPCAAC